MELPDLKAGIYLVCFLLVLWGFLRWDMKKQKEQPRCLLVRLRKPKLLSTRPYYVSSEEEKNTLLTIHDVIEELDIGQTKFLHFFGKVTMDLMVEITDVKRAISQLKSKLKDYPVEITYIGQAGDLKYERKMWRYL